MASAGVVDDAEQRYADALHAALLHITECACLPVEDGASLHPYVPAEFGAGALYDLCSCLGLLGAAPASPAARVAVMDAGQVGRLLCRLVVQETFDDKSARFVEGTTSDALLAGALKAVLTLRCASQVTAAYDRMCPRYAEIVCLELLARLAPAFAPLCVRRLDCNDALDDLGRLRASEISSPLRAALPEGRRVMHNAIDAPATRRRADRFLEGVLSRHLVCAGGAMRRFACGSACPPLGEPELDLYLVDVEPAQVASIVQAACAAFHARAQCLHSRAYRDMAQAWLSSGQDALTVSFVKNEDMDLPLLRARFWLHAHASVEQLLLSLDHGPDRVAYDGTHLWATESFRFSMYHGLLVPHPLTPSTPQRVHKLHREGFWCALPQSLPGYNEMRGLLCECTPGQLQTLVACGHGNATAICSYALLCSDLAAVVHQHGPSSDDGRSVDSESDPRVVTTWYCMRSGVLPDDIAADLRESARSPTNEPVIATRRFLDLDQVLSAMAIRA